MRCHLVARCGADEVLLAGVFPPHGAAQCKGRKDAEILGDHFLLAAKPAAHTFGEDMHVGRWQREDVAKLLLDDERRLRAGADMEPPSLVAPGDRAACLEMGMLHT